MMSDIVVSGIFLVLFLIFMRETRNYNYYSAIFPQFVLGLLLILTTILLIKAFIVRKKRSLSDAKPISLKDLSYILIVVVLSFLWIYVMDRFLGFLVGSMVFGVGIFAILAGKSLKLKEFVLLSVVLCAIVLIFWFALGKLLLVPFPTGLLF
ncbi:tripartite tricarboxylate transporter TctB family protein [Pseudothermotoga sp.]|nr:tripartite tricarboxylate transporter TctB family protein [Pseudothermotoga sp.]MCX7813791.1 tripartite tricarboxylate transporter TctB family protein [Pseudothermotoga sp.]MDW8140609.1 tripartite tricarboxylate transporter TctB family protein [Pseudothermotoga sp.]